MDRGRSVKYKADEFGADTLLCCCLRFLLGVGNLPRTISVSDSLTESTHSGASVGAVHSSSGPNNKNKSKNLNAF